MSDPNQFPGAPAYNPMHGMGGGEPGKIRSSGMCVLLFFVTCGIYGVIYYYLTHEEMRRHSNQGIGGVVALLLALFIGVVSPFLLSAEVGNLRQSRGQEPKVSGLTGLWYLPGMFIIVGPFIWFFKTNNALNDYWASQGVRTA